MAKGRKNTGAGDNREASRDSRQHRFTPREILRLILATYRASLSYLLIFIAGLLLATWLLTELVF